MLKEFFSRIPLKSDAREEKRGESVKFQKLIQKFNPKSQQFNPLRSHSSTLSVVSRPSWASPGATCATASDVQREQAGQASQPADRDGR